MLGADSPVTQFIKGRAAPIKHLIELRNYQEHPTPEQQTVVRNCYVAPDGRIGLPDWHVTGSPTRPIHEDMAQALPFLIETADYLLAHLVEHAIDPNWPIVIVTVPDNEQSPNAPIRLRTSIDTSRIRVPKEPELNKP